VWNSRYYPRLLLVVVILAVPLSFIGSSVPLISAVLLHALTVVGLVALVLLRRKFTFSNLSYTLIFLFICLHILGARYFFVVATHKQLEELLPIAEQVQLKERRLLEGMSKGVSLLEMLNFEEHCAAIRGGKASKLEFRV